MERLNQADAEKIIRTLRVNIDKLTFSKITKPTDSISNNVESCNFEYKDVQFHLIMTYNPLAKIFNQGPAMSFALTFTKENKTFRVFPYEADLGNFKIQPISDIEDILLEIWQKAVDKNKLDVKKLLGDDFFD